MRTLASAVLAAILSGASTPSALAAQEPDTTDASQPGWSVERTMREFAHDLNRKARGYFPTRGDWTWVLTTRSPGERDRVGVHRFPAAQADAAIASDGPVCDYFSAGDAVVLGTPVAPGIDLMGTEWRRVRGTRFVPQGLPASFPVFVEWRQEDGRWVISAFGGEARKVSRGAGNGPGELKREPRAPLRLPLPATEAVAAGAPWFVNHEPITVDGRRLNKYGLPRALAEGQVVRYSSVHGVGVYVERRARGLPDVVYVVVDRSGMFQPYESMISNGCAH